MSKYDYIVNYMEVFFHTNDLNRLGIPPHLRLLWFHLAARGYK